MSSPFALRKAKAYWLAGNLQAARDQLDSPVTAYDSSLAPEIERLRRFLYCP